MRSWMVVATAMRFGLQCCERFLESTEGFAGHTPVLQAYPVVSA